MKSVEFEYFLDEKTGEITLSFSRGTLNEAQQNALIKEIERQQTKLIVGESGYFSPQSPIPGLPEDIAFKYLYKKVSSTSRSVTFNMSWEGATSESPQERKEDVPKQIIADTHSTSHKENREFKQQDWVTLYIGLLGQRLNSLSHDSLDRAEKVALDYTVDELRRFLTSNHENNTLLLFSAYLHFAVTHFWQIDREKAALFLLAARSIEIETDTKSCAGTNKNLPVDDSFDKSQNIFAKIFQRFFSAKGS